MNKKLLAAILFFIPFLIYSQELSSLRVAGRGKLLQEELIDKNIKDANGETCAGLMVISDLDGLSYSSYNQVVKINRLPGKDLLFLSCDERVVEVYKNGYKPLKIILNEYGIKLSSGKVWQLEVSGDKKPDLIPVNILANRPDVKIFIDGIDKGTGKTHLVSPGSHELRLEKAGYKPVRETIEVNTNNTLFSYKLNEVDLVAVQVKSNPQGAKIYIDGIEKGETDDGFYLLQGKYRFKLIKTGYSDLEKDIDVTETGSNIFSYELVKNSGELVLKIEPRGARVEINKQSFPDNGTITLSPGRYRLDLSAEGYYDQSEMIEIVKGQTLNKTYSLTARKGNLQVKVKPLEANVRLLFPDGRMIESWQGLKQLKDLNTGSYQLECSLTGYETLSKKIIVEENRTTEENIVLSKAGITPLRADEKSGVQEIISPGSLADAKNSSISVSGQVAFLSSDYSTATAYGFNLSYGLKVYPSLVLGGVYSFLAWKADGSISSSGSLFMLDLKYYPAESFWISLSSGYGNVSYTSDFGGFLSSYSSTFSEGYFVAAPGAGFDFRMEERLKIICGLKYYLGNEVLRGPVLSAGILYSF